MEPVGMDGVSFVGNAEQVSVEMCIRDRDSSLLWLIVIGLACNLLMSGIGYLITLKKSADEKAFYMINLAGYNIGCLSLIHI